MTEIYKSSSHNTAHLQRPEIVPYIQSLLLWPWIKWCNDIKSEVDYKLLATIRSLSSHWQERQNSPIVTSHHVQGERSPKIPRRMITTYLMKMNEYSWEIVSLDGRWSFCSFADEDTGGNPIEEWKTGSTSLSSMWKVGNQNGSNLFARGKQATLCQDNNL